MKYNGFISYSHSSDNRLAAAIQAGLHRLAKPFLKSRAVEICLDRTNLAANPALWPSIQRELEQSEWFILLASPAAAVSEWVKKEVSWWVDNRSAERILIVLTDGALEWDESLADFDWSVSTAVPKALRGKFSDMPKYVDLRWAKDLQDLTLKNTTFADAILDLAAPLHGKGKNELAGEELHQARRERRLAWSVAAVLTLLLIVSVMAGWVAMVQRDEAVAERKRAVAAKLIAESRAELDKRFDTSLLLALASDHVVPNTETRRALLAAGLARPRLKAYLHPGGGTVRSVAYGQDGKLLVTAAEDGRVFLWDIGTLRPLREQLTGERVTSVALSADGTRLATGSADGIVRLWEVKSGRPLGEPLIGRLHSVPEVIFVGDGKLLAIESKDSSVVVWDADNRAVRAEISAEKNQSVTAVTVSLDGKRLAIGSTPGRWDLGSSAVVLWDLENRTPIGERILPRGRGVFSLALSSDGKRLATGSSDGLIILWDSEGRKQLGELAVGHWEKVNRIAFDPEEKYLVAGISDGRVILWDVMAHEDSGTLLEKHENSVLTLALSPDGKTVASGSRDGTVILSEREIGNRLSDPLPGPTTGVTSYAFSPDTKVLATAIGKGTVVLWDLEARKLLGELRGHKDWVSNIAFTPDGKRLATRSNDHRVIVWDVGSRGPGRIVEGLNTPTGGVAFKDNYHLAIASGDSVILWDIESGTRSDTLLKEHNGRVGLITFSREGKYAATWDGRGNTVRLWNATSRKPWCDPLKHKGRIWSVNFSPDGTTIATAGREDAIRLWDIASCRALGEPLAGTGYMASAAFGPDGKILATTSRDKNAILWDLQAHRRLGELPAGDRDWVIGAAFSLDGKRLITLGSYGAVFSWEVDPATWKERACRVANRNLTCAEWENSLAGLAYAKVCPDLPEPPDISECATSMRR